MSTYTYYADSSWSFNLEGSRPFLLARFANKLIELLAVARAPDDDDDDYDAIALNSGFQIGQYNSCAAGAAVDVLAANSVA